MALGRGYAGSNNPTRILPTVGDSSLSPIDDYALFRNDKRYRRQTVQLDAAGAPGNTDRKVFQSDGVGVQVEGWQVYPVTPGGTGTISIYHDQQDANGFATLVLNVGDPPVEYPGSGDNQSGSFWFIQNNSLVPVVVSLLWRAWS
jgi:hypothetical protein